LELRLEEGRREGGREGCELLDANQLSIQKRRSIAFFLPSLPPSLLPSFPPYLLVVLARDLLPEVVQLQQLLLLVFQLGREGRKKENVSHTATKT
jgi:hypothetical protein